MIFTSWNYLLFLPIVFMLTFTLGPRARPLFLLIASYLFYMAWKPKYVLVIIALTVFDYFAAIFIQRVHSQSSKRLLWLSSLAANLGMLFVFKYLGFFTRELNSLLQFLNQPTTVPIVDLILPIGISFHTFQAISYTTDVYLGTQKAEENPIRFALFIAWFPQMVAGPIERGSSLLPQLSAFTIPRAIEIRSALWLILWGFFKKLVVADHLAAIADRFFANPGASDSFFGWLAIYSFAFQIYCDFSGYTDIAKGSSQLFGIRLTENFNLPYLSRSLPEFWKRWHISLSSWFFEYVYYPFVRHVPLRASPWLGIIVVFLLSGVWHGANWMFLSWGLVNALFYLLYTFANRVVTFPDHGYKKWLLIALNFHVVCFCWIFFRSPSGTRTLEILKKIVEPPSTDLWTTFQASDAIGLIGLVTMAFLAVIKFQPDKMNWLKFTAISLVLIIAMLTLAKPGQSFIYFQF